MMDRIDGTKLSEFWTASKGFDIYATIGQRDRSCRGTVLAKALLLSLPTLPAGLVFVFPVLRALLTDAIFQVSCYLNPEVRRCRPSHLE